MHRLWCEMRKTGWSSTSSLKQYKLAMNGTGVASYLRSVQGQEVVKLLLRLRTGSAGLLEDRNKC